MDIEEGIDVRKVHHLKKFIYIKLIPIKLINFAFRFNFSIYSVHLLRKNIEITCYCYYKNIIWTLS